MKLKDLPAATTFLDVDSIAVARLPDGALIAFRCGDGVGADSRPYPNAQKAGTEGDVISRGAFERWLITGRPQPLGS